MSTETTPKTGNLLPQRYVDKLRKFDNSRLTAYLAPPMIALVVMVALVLAADTKEYIKFDTQVYSHIKPSNFLAIILATLVFAALTWATTWSTTRGECKELARVIFGKKPVIRVMRCRKDLLIVGVDGTEYTLTVRTGLVTDADGKGYNPDAWPELVGS